MLDCSSSGKVVVVHWLNVCPVNKNSVQARRTAADTSSLWEVAYSEYSVAELGLGCPPFPLAG